MMFTKAILKTEYLPPIASFWAALNAEVVVMEHQENYQKKSTRNRAKILGVNGIEVLSVPLKKGKNNRMPIHKVEIANKDSWQSKHLHSIKSAYGNSPYFDFYFEPLRDILKTEFQYLTELNQRLFQFFTTNMHLDIVYTETQTYHKSYPETDLDLRNISFNNPEIARYEAKKYNQVFEEKHGFIEGISILDLLMCKGPESILYI